MSSSFFSKKQRNFSKGKRNGTALHMFREWISSIFFAIVTAVFIRWMIVGLYVIPSESMESTLLSGDFVLVSKLHYGARTPVTPFQLPLTHKTLPLFSSPKGKPIPAYLNWLQLPSYRLPGFSKVKRNDIIVFNMPVGSEPADLRDYWIKRCVALPGDSVHIAHKVLYINGMITEPYDTVQYRYFVRTKRNLTNAFFEKNGIKHHALVRMNGHEGYAVYTTPEKVKQWTTVLPAYIYAVDPVEDELGQFQPSIYPFSPVFNWTKDNFGLLQVPKKGMTIELNAENIVLYGQTIAKFEGNKSVEFAQQACWINGRPVTTYTFCKDYYFVMGDNRDNSCDSRFIGFVPEEYIVGKAVMVLLSSDRSKNFWQGIRWNRLLQSIN